MTAPADNPALSRYRTHAARLGKRFQDLSSEEVMRSVADFLPRGPAAVLDIGAGSGRDAAWFTARGCRVTAVEPVREMAAQAAGLPGAAEVEWIDDRLPELAALTGRREEFDLCLLSGVWHHLPEADRPAALARLAALLRPAGRIVMSLRIGPEADGETIFPIDADAVIGQAAAAGFAVEHRAATASIQPANIAAGVRWIWLVLRRPTGATP